MGSDLREKVWHKCTYHAEHSYLQQAVENLPKLVENKWLSWAAELRVLLLLLFQGVSAFYSSFLRLLIEIAIVSEHWNGYVFSHRLFYIIDVGLMNCERTSLKVLSKEERTILNGWGKAQKQRFHLSSRILCWQCSCESPKKKKKKFRMRIPKLLLDLYNHI